MDDALFRSTIRKIQNQLAHGKDVWQEQQSLIQELEDDAMNDTTGVAAERLLYFRELRGLCYLCGELRCI